MTNDNGLICRFCGATLKSGAQFCRYCGSDIRTGWSENTYLDGIDLADDFDYQDTIQKEFPNLIKKKKNFTFKKLVNIFVGAILLIVILFILVYMLIPTR